MKLAIADPPYPPHLPRVRERHSCGRRDARPLSSGMKNEIPTPPAWAEPLGAYLEWLRGIRRSDGTIYQHSYQLRRFARATGADPWPVTTAELVAYMATLTVGKSALRSVRQVFRGFYAWGVLVERWDKNPAVAIPSVPVQRGVPRPAPEHSVKVGLHAPDPRTRLMVALEARTGARCREVALVRPHDIQADLIGRSILLHGKGDKERLVPIPDDLVREIHAYAAERGIGAGDWLFPGRVDGHLSAARVSELVSAALPTHVTGHMLRHRYGTRAFHLGGKDIRAVRDLLGHASVATTEIYVDVDDDAIRRAALAAAAS